MAEGMIQYQFKNHKRKQTVLEKIISSLLNELIAGQDQLSTQFPDLLVYSPQEELTWRTNQHEDKTGLPPAQKKDLWQFMATQVTRAA
jgi:hypothetical protein